MSLLWKREKAMTNKNNDTAMAATPSSGGGWEGRFFNLEELTCSPKAQANRIGNVPTAEAGNNLKRLVRDVLDPLRERWGVPIHVNSGYRCPELNRLVGGAARSYHLRGMAADITSRCPFHNTALFTEIRIMHDKGLLPLTECYMSQQGTYIHLAYDPNNVKQNPFLDR